MNEAQRGDASTGTFVSWIVDNRALAVPVLYLFTASIGVFYYWVYFRHFGINIFEFADASDFLVMSFRKPVTWACVILAVVVVVMDNTFSARVHPRLQSRWFRWYGSPGYRRTNYYFGIAGVFFYIWFFASLTADRVIAGEGSKVSVILADGEVRDDVALLGTSAQFVFVYDDGLGRVWIHPHESVRELVVVLPVEADAGAGVEAEAAPEPETQAPPKQQPPSGAED